MDLTVTIGNGKLPNPVGVASGTFGYGSEYESLIELSKLGAIYSKAVTLEPRPGNDAPRLVETPSGMLNSIGLANVGVERFLTDKMPFLARQACAVVCNVAGSGEDDYLRVVERLETHPDIFGYEINVSCPNVKHGGLALGTDPVLVERLVRRVRGLTRRPVIVKLTPNVTDITVVARAAENGGGDAISCINSLVGMVIDVGARRPVLPAGCGGLSGPAIRPVGVALTYRVSRAVSIPVIGIGGIMSADDALQYLLAGASAVQIGCATFVDPSIPGRVLSGIADYMTREQIACVQDIRGLLQ
ncbi:MAG: dihydroorotate dehydrogenase [Chitinivibrionales bacterium]|nr:dihydroorotate dehydrogenase [Chitinivibrionales bacterium]MBD3395926.1 dihydroorotate dehydrogenase [Chitinivibrionales bacterium]